MEGVISMEISYKTHTGAIIAVILLFESQSEAFQVNQVAKASNLSEIHGKTILCGMLMRSI